MRSAPSLVAAVGISLLTSFGARAGDGQTVAVLELRSQVHAKLNTAALTDQIREVARRTSPESRVLPHQEMLVVPSQACTYDCDVISAREQGADLVATGEISATASAGFRVSLTLRSVQSGHTLAHASAESSNSAELSQAVVAAASDLFRAAPQPPPALASAPGSAPATVIAIDAPALPELPALQSVPEGGAVNLSVDANVLVAYDHARNVEVRGKERPDDAAYAWEAVANADGENPYRALAASRAQQWRQYADNKHGYEAQLARDTSRLRKVLPLSSVTDAVKLELLTRYAHAYGATRATTLLPYVPAGALRDHAVLVMGCEGNDPGRCIALAKFADENNDAKAAADAWEHACTSGAYASCPEAANRFLAIDAQRAVNLLNKGCVSGDAKSCTQAARLYEQGTSVKSDAALANGFRERACDAGDGKSCRKLANSIDTGDTAADQKRTAELWRKGCAAGDNTSCMLAHMAGQPSSQNVKPAVSVPVQAAPPPKPTQVEADNTGHPALGAALVGIGLLAAGGAFILATEGPDTSQFHSGRSWLATSNSMSGPHANFIPVLGATAVLSTVTGLGMIWLSKHDSQPKAGDVDVAVSPTGVVLQGKM
jgi:hypothetical protein